MHEHAPHTSEIYCCGSVHAGPRGSIACPPVARAAAARRASVVDKRTTFGLAAMGDVVLQAADETERLGTIELAKANPQTQMLARWLKTQHFMQRDRLARIVYTKLNHSI